MLRGRCVVAAAGAGARSGARCENVALLAPCVRGARTGMEKIKETAFLKLTDGPFEITVFISSILHIRRFLSAVLFSSTIGSCHAISFPPFPNMSCSQHVPHPLPHPTSHSLLLAELTGRVFSQGQVQEARASHIFPGRAACMGLAFQIPLFLAQVLSEAQELLREAYVRRA